MNIELLRYQIASDYLNNQTEESWNVLVQRILVSEERRQAGDPCRGECVLTGKTCPFDPVCND